MPDLPDLLERGVAPEPERPPLAAIVRRGRQRRTRRRVALGTAGLAVAAAVALVAVPSGAPRPGPVIESPPSEAPSPATSTTSSESPSTDPVADPTAMADPPELGPELSVDDLADLPAEGVAVQVSQGDGARVGFLQLDGTVVGHLPTASLAAPSRGTDGGPTTGPLLLAVESRADGGYVEVGQGEVRRLGRPDASTGTTPERWLLAHGYVLERRLMGEPAGYHLVGPDGDTGFVLSTGGTWAVGTGREVVAQALGRIDERQPTDAYDLVTGERVELPAGCLPHDRTAEGMVVVCWDRDAPFEDLDWARVDLHRGDGTVERLLDPFVWPDQSRVSGHYRWASVSPDGQWVAAQHSGECEVPTAMVAPRRDTSPRALVEVTGQAVESHFHGWTADSRALVTTGEGLCGTGYDVPGLYLVDPSGGEPELLWEVSPEDWRTIQPWGPLGR